MIINVPNIVLQIKVMRNQNGENAVWRKTEVDGPSSNTQNTKSEEFKQAGHKDIGKVISICWYLEQSRFIPWRVIQVSQLKVIFDI